jgi:hypothetical protein
MNHSIKNEKWSDEDKNEFYKLKDDFLKTLFVDKPWNMIIYLYYIPYFRYCTATKDNAGELMRKDSNKMPFEYYLLQVKPSKLDVEIKERSTVEMKIEYLDTHFSFHIPAMKVKDWDIDLNDIPRKVWISNKDYRETRLNNFKQEVDLLIKQLNKSKFNQHVH